MTDTTGSRRSDLSLGTRLFLVTSLLILLSVAAAVLLTSVRVRAISRSEAVRTLEGSAAAQAAVQEQRLERLRLMSRLFAADSYLAAYLGEASKQADTASILDLLDERQKELGYDFAILLDPAGKVIARSDNPNASGQDLSRRPLVAKALTDSEGEGVWSEGDRLYYAVAVSVVRDYVFGYLITGFAIDDATVKALNEISGSDIAVVTLGGKPQVIATTLPPAMARSLASHLGPLEASLHKAMESGEDARQVELDLDGEPWLALPSVLMDAAGRPVGTTIALASLGRALSTYREIETVLIAAGILSALLVGGLSFALVRRTLQPVRHLAAAAEAARQGNYDQRIEVESGDEIGRLAGAFDELLADLREKRDMATYVTELSRNLPEPAQGKVVAGSPQVREVLLMGVELRRFARPMDGAGPQATLDMLEIDLKRVSNAVSAHRGQVEGTVGHRVLARFEGAEGGGGRSPRRRRSWPTRTRIRRPRRTRRSWRSPPGARSPGRSPMASRWSAPWSACPCSRSKACCGRRLPASCSCRAKSTTSSGSRSSRRATAWPSAAACSRRSRSTS